MRLGIVCIPRPLEGVNTIDRIVQIARKTEELDFAGLWVTDAFARGSATLDPIAYLGVLCGVTSRIELGACVIQVPLRHPVEHAHRVQTINELSKGRFIFGIGSGSTKHDFDAVEADYDARFKTMTRYLDIMQRTWNGEGVFGPPLTAWPGTEGGPRVMLGAWRSERWINLAAGKLNGWISSGIYSAPEDIAIGLKMFRAAGGKRAVLANVFTDFRGPDAPNSRAAVNRVSLYCTPAEAKDRLKRLEDLGLDDVLLMVPFDAPEQLEAMRGLA
jgi:alkanesulfonate monooxygenase SsuD/methylene tetrahydromethanopterin reductase-like flavin-dependent oxidoreductase (luciferase family)